MTTSLQEIRELYTKEFSERFTNIARMADKNDDVGYGKGLAKLQIDIEDYIISLIKERDAEMVEKMEGFKAPHEHDPEYCGDDQLMCQEMTEKVRMYNLGVSDCQLLLTTTPTEGGE